ncbi:MAG: hypothetical protein DWQ05_07830 [Calditrichaeota bacterium]|nr:MAG: hypothetical protein DWQ05_07830 [Calditrichota bacterium]
MKKISTGRINSTGYLPSINHDLENRCRALIGFLSNPRNIMSFTIITKSNKCAASHMIIMKEIGWPVIKKNASFLSFRVYRIKQQNTFIFKMELHNGERK